MATRSKPSVRRSAATPKAAVKAHPPDGTQAIRRAAAILKAVARATPASVSLADISRSERLARSTAHRMLKCLQDEGLIAQAKGSLGYQMGPLVYELGLAVPCSALEVARWSDAVDAVARRTGVTTYLMRRTGLEAVCLLKSEGRSLVRVIPVEVGQRRLLGVGAGATALLAALDESTTDTLIDLIAPELINHPRIDAHTLRLSVEQARRNGVAISRGRVMEQSFGLGIAVPQTQGPPTLAISIAAHLPSVTETDITQWSQIIGQEIDQALALQKGASH